MESSSVRLIVGRYVSAGLLAGAGMFSSVPVYGLQVTAAVPEPAARHVQRVSVDFDRAPVATVVQEIARQAGLTVSYNRNVIPDGTRVTVRLRNVLAEEAFNLALQGTRLGAEIRRSGNVLIFPVSDGVQSGVIVGKVLREKTKQPVADAVVSVEGRGQVVRTSSDGTFRLSVEKGVHTVHVRAVGMQKRARQIQVGEGETVTVDFALESSASVLDEVIVTGTVIATERREIPTPITVITGDELEKRGITRIDQLFRGEVPGIIVEEVGTAAYMNSLGFQATSLVYSRGSSQLNGSANPLKTYIDGVEMLDARYLGTIDPKSIERIEIITGPQAATIYGSGAMGGVMQIFTRKGTVRRTPDVTLSLKYGILESNFSNGRTPSHGDGLILTGGTGPEFSYSGTLSYNYTGQWQPGLFSRGYGASIGVTHQRGPFTASGSFSARFGSNGTYRTGSSNELGVHKLYENGTRILDNGLFGNQSQQISISNGQNSAFNLDYRAKPWWQHHVTLGMSQTKLSLRPLAPRYSGYSSTVGADSLFQTSYSSGDRTTANYNTTLTLPPVVAVSSNLTLGINTSVGDRVQADGCLLTSIASSYVGCFQGSAPGVTRPLNDRSTGGFASWRLGVFNQLYVTLGLRGERNPSYGKNHKIDWTPTRGATYAIDFGDVSIKLLGSYGKSTRAPNPSWTREVITNIFGWNIPSVVTQLAAPDLTPEYSRGPQGGIEIYYGNLGSLTVNHYHQTVTDLIQSVLADSVPVIQNWDGWEGFYPQMQYRNVAKIRQFGWEGTGSLNIAWLSLRGTYFWNDSRVIEVSPKAPGFFRNEPLTHAGSISIGYSHGRTSATLVSNYVGAQIKSLDDFWWITQYFARHKMYVMAFTNNRVLPVRRSGYIKADLSASHRVAPGMDITLNIANLNNSYVSDRGLGNPTLGRQTSVGASLRFPSR